ncbi:MAG TPA: hypothetical protein VJO12_04550 [Stellaceae bacterium]|nr:hypothetical protein [Stellaceae bacterium]
MPFDGAGFQDRLQTLSKMDKTIDLLGDEARWCTKHWRTRDGRYCIRSAMAAVHGASELKKPVALAIRQVTGRTFLHIEHFNDHALTSHALVMRVLRQARANIAAGAAPVMPRPSAWARLYDALT